MVKMVKNTRAENHSGNRGLILGKQIHNSGNQQHGGNQHEPNGNFGLANVQIAGYFPGAISRLGEAQDKHGDGLHGEAPDHAERIERRQNVYVAQTENNREELQSRRLD